jgi:hypothetical protein
MIGPPPTASRLLTGTINAKKSPHREPLLLVNGENLRRESANHPRQDAANDRPVSLRYRDRACRGSAMFPTGTRSNRPGGNHVIGRPLLWSPCRLPRTCGTAAPSAVVRGEVGASVRADTKTASHRATARAGALTSYLPGVGAVNRNPSFSAWDRGWGFEAGAAPATTSRVAGTVAQPGSRGTPQPVREMERVRGRSDSGSNRTGRSGLNAPRHP